MLGLIKILQKRPSDLSIRTFRVVFGLTLSLSAYYSLIYNVNSLGLENDLFWITLTENGKQYLKYFIVCLGFFPLFLGLTNICLLKSKHMRIGEVIFAWFIFIASKKMVSGPELGVDTLYAFLGIFPLLAGITGKCITTKCLKYKQKIKKIRV